MTSDGGVVDLGMRTLLCSYLVVSHTTLSSRDARAVPETNAIVSSITRRERKAHRLLGPKPRLMP